MKDLTLLSYLIEIKATQEAIIKELSYISIRVENNGCDITPEKYQEEHKENIQRIENNIKESVKSVSEVFTKQYSLLESVE